MPKLPKLVQKINPFWCFLLAGKTTQDILLQISVLHCFQSHQIPYLAWGFVLLPQNGNLFVVVIEHHQSPFPGFHACYFVQRCLLNLGSASAVMRRETSFEVHSTSNSSQLA